MAESAILLYTSFILRPSHCPAFDITEKLGEGRSACFYQENVVSVYLEQKWGQNELEVFYCSICPGIGVANVHKVENIMFRIKNIKCIILIRGPSPFLSV